MKKRFPAWVLALSLLAGCLSGCARQPVSRTFFAMDTVMTIQAWGRGAGDAVTQAIDCINTLEQELSVTRPDSQIAQANAAGGGTLSGDALDLVSQALELCEYTGGALDITLGSVMELWGFRSGDYIVPEAEILASALAQTGWEKVQLSEDALTLPEGLKLDLGAVAKGYAAQKAADLLAQAGIDRAILTLGGNVQTLGTKADGSDWTVAVTDPEDPSAACAALSVSGTKAIVTSGGYQRYFEQDGVTYHHILDPETGCPAQGGLVSVTIVAEDGLLADALSTALFVMGLEGAVSFCLEHREFEAFLIAEDGSCCYTPGLVGRVETELEQAVMGS